MAVINAFLQEKQLRLSATLADLYCKVANQLAQAYQPGCIVWTQQHRPDLQQRVDEAEARVDQAWLDCEAGAGSVDAVKAALTDWYKAYRAAILAHAERS